MRGGDGRHETARGDLNMQPQAEGYRTVTPYLKLPNCGRLVEYLKKAFHAIETARLVKPDGAVLHAEVMIGDTLIMVHELPSSGKPKLGSLYLRVEDVDATYRRAIESGGAAVFEPADMYYGARVACVTDVAGNDWWIATQTDHLTLEEIQKRAAAFLEERPHA